MTKYKDQDSRMPTRKVAAGGIGGIVMGVPLASPLAGLAVGGLRLANEGAYTVLNDTIDLKATLASLFAVLIATATAYMVRERL